MSITYRLSLYHRYSWDFVKKSSKNAWISQSKQDEKEINLEKKLVKKLEKALSNLSTLLFLGAMNIKLRFFRGRQLPVYTM